MQRFRLLTLALAVSLAVAGCLSTPAPTPTPSPVSAGMPTAAPASPVQPAPSPTRAPSTGGATPVPATPSIAAPPATRVPGATAVPAIPAAALSLGFAAGNTYSAQSASLDAQRGLAYVVGRSGGDYRSASGMLAVVDLAGRRVRATAPLPLNPDCRSTTALSADGARLYILCTSGSTDPTLLVVNTGAGQGSLGDVLFQQPGVQGMALDAPADQLYLVQGAGLRQLDAATMTEQRSTTLPNFPSVSSPILMAAGHQAGRVYVSGPDSGSILIFRSQDMAAAGTVTVQGRIKQLLAAPDQDRLYALVESSGGPAAIAVVRNDRLAASWKSDQSFSSGRLAIDPATGRLLALDDAIQTDVQSSRIRLLDPATGNVIETMTIPYSNLTYAQETLVHGGHIYRLGEQLTPIALAGGGVGQAIGLGISLVSAALDAPANRLYLLDSTGAHSRYRHRELHGRGHLAGHPAAPA